MYNIINKFRLVIYIFLALFFSIMSVSALFYHSWSTRAPKITTQTPLLLFILAFAGLLLVTGLCLLGRKLSNISSFKLIPIVILFYIIVQVAFVFLMPVKDGSDPAMVVKCAKEILNGNYTSLQAGHYLSYYPNNLGISLVYVFLFSFLPKSYLSIRLFNVICTTVAVLFIYKLYREMIPEDKDGRYGVLLLSVTFLPAIILNNLSYGDVIASTFCIGAMLYAVKFVNTGKLKFAAIASVMLMFGNFTRGVALLFMIAIIFYWFINGIVEKKVNWRKVILGMLMGVLLFNLPLQIFSKVGVAAGMLEEPVGTHANPSWRWINLGFPYKDNIGYWDYGRNTRIFVKVLKCDTKKAKEFFIKDTLSKYKSEGLLNVINGYTKKTFWLWTEGTYSVNYFGLSQKKGDNKYYLYKTPLTQYLKPGNTNFRIGLAWILHAYNWILLILLALYFFIFAKRKNYSLDLFGYIIVIYIGFYLIWEIKARYLFGLYPIFIIIASYMLSLLFKRIKPIFQKPLQK